MMNSALLTYNPTDCSFMNLWNNLKRTLWESSEDKIFFFKSSKKKAKVALCLFIVGIGQVNAQPLEEQITNLLAQDQDGFFCSQLVGNSARDSDTGAPLDFGPQLTSLCVLKAPPGAGVIGTNAFSGGALSTLGQSDQVVKKRRLKSSEEKDDISIGGGASADADISLTSRMNLFFSAQYQSIDRRQTIFEQGYESNQKGFSFGADYLPTDWLVTGLAFNYSHWHGDFQNNSGGFATDSYGPILFASLFPWEGFFADFSFQYSHKESNNNNRRTYVTEDNRTFGGPIGGAPIANQYEGNVIIGYDHSFGGLTIGPRVNMRYRHADIGSYTESGDTGLELRFLDDSLNSLQTSVGAQASYAISTDWGVVIPQINADWTHEHENDQRTINVQFSQDLRANPLTFGFNTDAPDRDFFHVGAGVVAVLPRGFQAFANFQTVRGHSYFDTYIGTIGFRLEM